MRAPHRLARQLRLLLLLGRAAKGLSSVRLARELACSRATVDRDLEVLRERVGVRISPTRVNGEVWHRLDGFPLRLAVTPVQLAALRLARDALGALEGSAALRELDALPYATGPVPILAKPSKRAANAKLLARIEDAIVRGRRLAIVARVASRGGETRRYVVDPITLRLVDGEAYLDAWSIERDALRTFKVARVRSAQLLPESADRHDELDLGEVFRGSVKTWSGEPVRVRIRIAEPVAWLVPEYPLVADQRVVMSEDGAAIVEATVAGLTETSRWVLGWGRNATVLEPAELRELHVEELRGALEGYERDRAAIVSGPEGPLPSSRSRRHSLSTSRPTT